MNRPFNEAHYQQHVKGEIMVRKALVASGIDARLNMNLHGPDIIVYHKNKQRMYIEVEERTKSWNDGVWKFDSYHIPARKDKYCCLEIPLLFITIDPVSKKFIGAIDKIALASSIISIKTYEGFSEEFIDVSLTECLSGDLVDLHKHVSELISD